MIILGIETSCDETATAVLEQKEGTNLPAGRQVQILSNIVASSASLQSKYGGIIPEQAAREQLKSIIPVIESALRDAQCEPKDIDAIAVTYGPGLIGSLLVGVETAKTLSKVWQKPLIPVNHLIGHFYANWIDQTTDYSLPSTAKKNAEVRSRKTKDIPRFPCIGLLVSGGHTDLVLFKDHGEYEYLGGTRDDAAGECFDKCARILNLPYPGGPEISKYAATGNLNAFDLPSPLINSKDFDFSFSGLKTAVANLIHKLSPEEIEKNRNDLCAAIQKAIIKVLVKKTVAAAQKHNIDQIIVAGGVAANQALKTELLTNFNNPPRAEIFIPPPYLCTDNAAMIASAAFFAKTRIDPLKLVANPVLSLQV